MRELTDSPQESVADPILIQHALPEDAEGILMMKRAAWLATYVNEERGITEEDIYKKFPDSSMPESIANWEKGIAGETHDGKRFTFVAKEGDNVIGYTSPLIEDGKCRIGGMYVASDSQDKGVGGRLMRAALDWIGQDHDVYLDVVDYNQNAIGFYEHFGFVPSGKTLPLSVNKDGIKHLPQIEMVRRGHPSRSP